MKASKPISEALNTYLAKLLLITGIAYVGYAKKTQQPSLS